jgi:hypothetical protein
MSCCGINCHNHSVKQVGNSVYKKLILAIPVEFAPNFKLYLLL